MYARIRHAFLLSITLSICGAAHSQPLPPTNSGFVRVWVGVHPEYTNFDAMIPTLTPEEIRAQDRRVRLALLEILAPLLERKDAVIVGDESMAETEGSSSRLDALMTIGPNGLIDVRRRAVRVLMRDPRVGRLVFETGRGSRIWAPK